MLIRITKKLADVLRLSPEKKYSNDDFLSWRADYVNEDGFQFVALMNDTSRFTIVINNADEEKLRNLPALFVGVLRETLLTLGVNPKVVDRYVTDMGGASYAKNTDKQKTSHLVYSVKTVWWGLRSMADDVELSLYSNSMSSGPSYRDDDIYPTEIMLAFLARYRMPVLDCRAFDLNVRLDLDGRDAVRKLRVPENISFKRLHRLMQIAFGWQDCHLYSFGLFKKWSNDYYAKPDVKLLLIDDEYDYDPDAKIAAEVKLSDFLPRYRKILYTYDFGDEWRHYIEIVDITENYTGELPLMISGDGDAPPENIGGPGGFSGFLNIINDPSNEEYEQYKEWAKSVNWKPFDFNVTAGQLNHNQWRKRIKPETGVTKPDETPKKTKVIPLNTEKKTRLSDTGASPVPGDKLQSILLYISKNPNRWGTVITETPFGKCDNCGKPSRVIIDDNNANQIAELCDGCYNKMMAIMTGSNIPDIIPKKISVKGKNGKQYDFNVDFLVFATGLRLSAAEAGKLKRKAEVFGSFTDDFGEMMETLKARLQKEVSVKYMDKNGYFANNKAIGYIDYSAERDTYEIVIDGKPYAWEELKKDVECREGWKIKIEFADASDELK